MKESINRIRMFVLLSVAAMLSATASAQEQLRIPGTTCSDLAYLHCPDKECSSATVDRKSVV